MGSWLPEDDLRQDLEESVALLCIRSQLEAGCKRQAMVEARDGDGEGDG